MSRIRRALTMRDLVRQGKARVVLPTTDTGWRRYGTGREMLPASTNLVRDPQVVNDLDGTYWAAAPTDCTITPNTAVPLTLGSDLPTKCAKVVFEFDGSNYRDWESEVFAATAGQKHTLQCMVYIPACAASGNLTIYGVVMNGETEVRTVTLGAITAVNSVFTRYSTTATIAGSGETHIKYRYRLSGADMTLYATAHKVAVYGTVDPYHDGTLLDCAWTGTEHQSTSTRTASELVYTTGLPANMHLAGTVACRFMPLYAGTDSLAHGIWNLAGSTGGATTLKTSSNTIYARYTDATNNRDTSAVNTEWSANTMHSCVTKWTGSSRVDLNIDGTDATYGAVVSNGAAFATLSIGRTAAGTLALAHLGPYIVSATNMADASRTTLQTGSGAVYADIMGLWRNFMLPGDMLIPLQSDSVAYVKVV